MWSATVDICRTEMDLVHTLSTVVDMVAVWPQGSTGCGCNVLSLDVFVRARHPVRAVDIDVVAYLSLSMGGFPALAGFED